MDEEILTLVSKRRVMITSFDNMASAEHPTSEAFDALAVEDLTIERPAYEESPDH